MRRWRPYFLLPALALYLALAGCLLCTGCLAFDPGGQVRRAAAHRSEWGWSSEGNFNAEAQGPQTHTFKMREVTEEYDAEGRVTSRTEYSLESQPTLAPTETAFQQSTAQMEFIVPPMTQVLMRLIETLEKLAAPMPEVVDDG